jgi:anti-anti-sigma factor
MDMQIERLDDDVVKVGLAGRLDAAGADQIGTRFTAAAAGSAGLRVIIDLSGVDFLASMGIRLLISSARAQHGKGGRLVLFGARPLVAEVLEQAAIDQIIPTVSPEADALARLGD